MSKSQGIASAPPDESEETNESNTEVSRTQITSQSELIQPVQAEFLLTTPPHVANQTPPTYR